MAVHMLLFAIALAQFPAAGARPTQARPVPERKKGPTAVLTPYGAWKDAFRIANASVEVIVVPKIGRIVRFGYVGGPNLLWANPTLAGKERVGATFADYGGDKLWVAPQSMWGWPPPTELDSGPYVGTPIPDGLKLVGPRSPRFGIHMEREITVPAKGSEVRIVNRMVNDVPITIARSIWQCAQLDSPDVISVALRPSKSWPEGFYAYPDHQPASNSAQAKDGRLVIRLDPERSVKVGAAASDGRLIAVKGEVTFTMSTKYEGRGKYPDDGCAQQVFTSKQPDRYAALSLVGPIVWLKPKQSKEMIVKWTLAKTESPANGSRSLTSR